MPLKFDFFKHKELSNIMSIKCYAQYAYNKDPRKLTAVLPLLSDPDSNTIKQQFLRRSDVRQLFGLDDVKMQNDINNALKTFNYNYSPSVVDDMLISYVLYGVLPEEYFQFCFFDKLHSGRVKYFCDKERFFLFHDFYDYSKYEYVRDKWLQFTSLSSYFNRDCININNTINNEPLFRDFIKKHKDFIFKPTRLSCGQGVQHIKIDAETDVDDLYRQLSEKCGIADERIAQDKRLEAFHPDSLNTVRLIAFRGFDNHNYYCESLFRMGVGNNIVDNNSNAIRALVDTVTGLVYSEGSDSFGHHFITHPDTGEQIIGFRIPDWEYLIAMADSIMQNLSGYARFIGFDFALSNGEGWKIVEINPYPQLVTQQVIAREGCKEEMVDILRSCDPYNVYDQSSME